jgi:hypothetical protein
VLRWRDDRAIAVGSADHPEGVGVLRAWLAEIRHNRETPGLVTLEATLSAEAATPDHPAYEHFSRHDRIAIKLLQRAFGQIQEQGDLVESCTPDDAAHLVVGATIGLQALWAESGRSKSPRYRSGGPARRAERRSWAPTAGAPRPQRLDRDEAPAATTSR